MSKAKKPLECIKYKVIQSSRGLHLYIEGQCERTYSRRGMNRIKDDLFFLSSVLASLAILLVEDRKNSSSKQIIFKP